jgi:hypothetical protein
MVDAHRIFARTWIGAAVGLGLSLLLILAVIPRADAAIVETTNQITQIPAPADARAQRLESNTTMFAWDERQAVVLPNDVAVDITQAGVYEDVADLTPGVVPAGTVVDSHFVHADKVGTTAPNIVLQGTVRFDKPIVGIAIEAAPLYASDFLGAPGTRYPTSGRPERRLNLERQADFVIWQVDQHTVVIQVETAAHFDQVRILTAAREVPVPLEVTKTARGSFDRVITWDLTKSVDISSHSGTAGETAGSSTWSVTATKTIEDVGHTVEGSITIANPGGVAQSFSVEDVLSDGTVAAVTCPSLTVAANGEVVCTYTADTANATSNTATVQVAGQDPVTATAPVAYTANVVGDEAVTLADPRFSSTQTVTDTTTVTFPEAFTCPSDPFTYPTPTVTRTEINTATLTGSSTNLTRNAQVQVSCRIPEPLLGGLPSNAFFLLERQTDGKLFAFQISGDPPKVAAIGNGNHVPYLTSIGYAPGSYVRDAKGDAAWSTVASALGTTSSVVTSNGRVGYRVSAPAGFAFVGAWSWDGSFNKLPPVGVKVMPATWYAGSYYFWK